MSTRDRLSVASALAVLLACTALLPLYDGGGWVVRVGGAVLLVAVACAGARTLGLPRLLHPLAGLLGLAAYVALVFAGTTLAYGALPTGETLAALGTLLGEGLLDVEQLAPPVPTTPGLVLLAVLGAGAVAVVVDTLAVTLRQAALAGLPLLLLFAVPSAVLAGGLGTLPFVAGAAGWMGLLLADSSDTVSRWGTPLQRRAGATADPSLGRVGRRIGVAALGVAVVVPALVPGLDARLLGGDGDGLGGGSRRIDTYNPITRLAGQLRLPEPRELLRYTTSADAPDYLRLTTLDRFDTGSGWSSSDLAADKDEDAARDSITRPVGLTLPTAGLTEVQVRLTGDLEAAWLPLPFPPQDVDIDERWLWDPEAETVFSTRTSLARQDEPYGVRALVVQPTADQLRRPGGVPQEVQADYASPVELTAYVQSELERVTGALDSDYDRVAALQAYFLDGRRFRYDLDATPPGSLANDPLENFLKGGAGFCEQYASAMAAMVRGLGVPARVAVGFTPGRRDGDEYVVTTSEAHAWPEVFFAGAGWVRFEPTPRTDQQTSQPSYSTAPAPVDAGPVPSAAPSVAPSTAPAAPDEALPEDRAGQDGTVGPVAGADDGLPSPWLLLVPAGLLLAAVPLLLATLRARRRWRAPSAAVAWAAVRDDAADVGHRWRPPDSPRAAAAHLLSARALPEPAAAALSRLAAATERARYARPDAPAAGAAAGGAPALRADVATVRAGLLATAPGRVRWTARLAPPSTLRWASAGLGTATADLLDRLDGAVTTVGARLRHPRRAT